MSGEDRCVYQEVFESIQNPVLIIDPNFVIEDANPAAAEFLDYPSKTALQGTAVSSMLYDPDVIEEVAEAIAAGKPWEGRTELLTHGGEVIAGRGSAVPITIDGEFTCIAGLFVDLTRQEQYSRSLNILNRVLRHNIRNEINIIQGTLGMIDEDCLAEGDVERLNSVEKRLATIVDRANTARRLEELLDFDDDQIEATVRIDELLCEAIATVASEYPEAKFVFPDSFGARYATANRTAVRAFEAVLENAVEHNDTAEPTVWIDVSENDDSVTVEIEDNGPGIDPEREDIVFGREETDQLNHGDGISLFFVDQLFRIYGGSVGVQAGEEGGARFCLTFPRTGDTE
ncbi:sensor histidine kinase [Halalkalirubrum salinum]|uniref:sensor histidine kinase n=1 Tax=Halalkalirubrum salinum TaxID=2563889 RepID=UPI0010FB6026|nr:PAS domain-containing sensor histidine kinase [Halalkalirubrum salinum]